jgi:hypothetical protein
LAERYKFYLSLDLSTEEKKTKAHEMYQEIITLSKDKKLSLQIKCQDHVYDSGNIYTFDFVAMQEIITALYQKYCCY